MLNFKFLLVILSIFGLCGPAVSQNILDYVETGPAAPWVIVNDVPDTPFSLGDGVNAQYLLVDQQRRVSAEIDALYRHYATGLPSTNAVEQNSTITIDFDPEYQSIVLHSVQLRRDGDVIDLMDLAAFDVFRMETDREKLIYNGLLQMAYVVPGVRVGDVLEYAYTISGRNPAIGPHFFGRFQHNYGVPVQNLFQRFSYAEGTEVKLKTYNAPQEPEKSSADGFTAYTWDLSDVAIKDIVDDNLPYGYESYAITEISSFREWAEVGSYFHTFYDASDFQTDKVLEIAETIKASTADRSEQLRAALDYVQQEVRYLGIELGPGGYIPRPPDLVLERRFGDCKDMVVLLTSILKALDIEANPLLVDFDYRDQVVNSVPTHAAFDHVVAMAKLDGETYFLDPTRGPQLGDLAHLQQADFGKGVVIAADGPGMVDAIAPRPVWQKDVVDQYDLTDPNVAKFTTTSVFRMEAADRMLSRKERNGLLDIDDGYFGFYQGVYPTIERDGPLALDIDEDTGKVTITAAYLIPDYWELDEDSGEETFSFSADEIVSVTPSIERSDREGPYELAYPTAIRQKLIVKTDDEFGEYTENETSRAPGLIFSNRVFAQGGHHEQEFSYTITERQIDAKDVSEHMDLVETVDAVIWRIYTRSDNSVWDTHFEDLWLAYMVLAITIPILVTYLHRNNDVEDRKHQIFYPVGTFKFTVLSVATVGVYQVFWVFKNWQWLRDVKGETNSPFWRTVFEMFTNFRLFPRIVKEAPAGSALVTAIAPFCAVLIVISNIADVITRRSPDHHIILEWISFAGIFVMIPMAREVLRKNVGNEEYVSRNSRFGWPAIGMILLFLPFFVGYVYEFLLV